MSDEKQNLLWLLEGLPEFRKEAQEIAQESFKKEIESINQIAALLGSLAFFTMENKSKKNILLSDTYPATDWQFHAHVTDLINTLLSIKELCVDGFDTQARALVRVLDERIYQALILFSSAKDYQIWKNAEDTKQAYYDLFSKKKSKYKKLLHLDQKYLETTKSDELIALRAENDKYYSDTIHGANTSIYAGAVAYPFGDLNEGPFVSAIYGRASSCSYQTLHHSIGQMSYFVLMIGAILEDIHSLGNIEGENLIYVFKSNRYSVIEKSMKLIMNS